jgi:aldehyde dehydrogenase (NAD+)
MSASTANGAALPPLKLLIGGEFADAASGATEATVDPVTEEVIGEVASAGPEDVARAVGAAREAFDDGPWSAMRAAERGRIMNAFARLLREREDVFTRLESLDTGKPMKAVRRQDFAATIDCLEYFAGWPDKIKGDVIPVRPDALTYVDRVPVGVVAAIIPWNFPGMHATWKIAPALACGCTVVLKPAAETPLTALLLGALALEAGLPDGVLNVIPGPGPTAGMPLVRDRRVDKISFTGSPVVGRMIATAAAQNVTRVTLELGGKSPNIVFGDADVGAAVRAASSGVFFNAGQVCSAGSRILVERSIYDEFADRMVSNATELRAGDPADSDTYLGPLISQKQLDRVLGYIEVGRREGAQLRIGGARLERTGYFVPPTIFSDVENTMTIAREEVFGPVASLIRFDGPDDAIRIANDSSYTLAAGVWTHDLALAHSVSRRLRAGTVWVNTYGQSDARLPWGGFGGDSGIGRDLGESALDVYTERKSVWVNHRL